MSFTFRKASRERVGLLIGVAGPSGAGKTYSCLRLATGMADGRPFAVIDTEAGRAKHYADAFTFDHGDLAPPFTPDRYLEALLAAESAGYPVIVTDSMSHEWAGDGGCCDMQEAELTRMAGDDWRKREASKVAAWIRPKLAHKKLVARLLQLRAHLIFAFRAEPKIEMVKGQDGKMQVVPKRVLGWSSEWIPVTEKNFLFEMTASFVLSPDCPGVPLPIKLQEQHRPFFPAGQPITEDAGRALAAWARGGGAQTDRAPAPRAAAATPEASHPEEASGGASAGTPLDRAVTLRAIAEAVDRWPKPPPAPLWAAICQDVCGTAEIEAEGLDVAVLGDLLALVHGYARKDAAARLRIHNLARRLPAVVA